MSSEKTCLSWIFRHHVLLIPSQKVRKVKKQWGLGVVPVNNGIIKLYDFNYYQEKNYFLFYNLQSTNNFFHIIFFCILISQEYSYKLYPKEISMPD